MTTPGRLAAALVVVAVSAALPLARTPAAPGTPAATATFSAMGLSFRYPATWHRGSWDEVSSFTALIVYLSTEPLHNPCTITHSPGVTSVDCTNPVDVLPPGGVLVRWDDNGFPVSFWKPKPNTTIAGHPAEETVTSGPGWCASLGGAETITITIPRHPPDNFYEMDACLSAPNLSQQQAQISAMLRTVHLAGGD